MGHENNDHHPSLTPKEGSAVFFFQMISHPVINPCPCGLTIGEFMGSTNQHSHTVFFSWVDFLSFVKRALPLSVPDTSSSYSQSSQSRDSVRSLETPPSKPVWETRQPLKAVEHEGRYPSRNDSLHSVDLHHEQEAILGKQSANVIFFNLHEISFFFFFADFFVHYKIIIIILKKKHYNRNHRGFLNY